MPQDLEKAGDHRGLRELRANSLAHQLGPFSSFGKRFEDPSQLPGRVLEVRFSPPLARVEALPGSHLARNQTKIVDISRGLNQAGVGRGLRLLPNRPILQAPG